MSFGDDGGGEFFAFHGGGAGLDAAFVFDVVIDLRPGFGSEVELVQLVDFFSDVDDSSEKNAACAIDSDGVRASADWLVGALNSSPFLF